MSLVNQFRARIAFVALAPVVAFTALSLPLLSATPAVAQTKLNSVIKSLFGKTRPQVEAKAGKGKPAQYGAFAYKYPGVKSIDIQYAPADYGDPEWNSRVLSISVRFLKPLPGASDDWKEALRRAGFSTEGVILGNDTTKSKGFFKNVTGIPEGFIGFTNKDSLHITHWSYLTLSMSEFSRPKGE